LILLPHNSPRAVDEAIARDLFAWQALLRGWFQTKIDEAKAHDHDRKGPEWWVWQSNARCQPCRVRKLRITIRAHPDGPFYLCPVCGSLETLLDLTR